MTALSLGAAGTLWQRELTRFFRQPSRIAGAVGTPLIVWLLVGSGLSGSSFHCARFWITGLIPWVSSRSWTFSSSAALS